MKKEIKEYYKRFYDFDLTDEEIVWIFDPVRDAALEAAGLNRQRQGVPFIGVSIIILWTVRWHFNVLSLSEEERKAMGVNIKLLRKIIILCTTLITAVSVSLSGIICFVGLVVPHFARMVVGHEHRMLVPVSILMGGVYLLTIDTLARTITAVEIPLSILTAITGAPVFAWFLRRTGGDGMINVNNISFGYQREQFIFKDLSFSLARGETLSILGPNGVGKTTLIKYLLGFLKLSQGEILLENKSIAAFSTKGFFQKVNYVPQAKQMVFPYSILDMVLMGRASSISIYKSLVPTI